MTSLPIHEEVAVGEAQCGLTSCSGALEGRAQVTEEGDLTGNDITRLIALKERNGVIEGEKEVSSVFLLSNTSSCSCCSNIGAWFFCCIRSASFDLFRNPTFDGNLHD